MLFRNRRLLRATACLLLVETLTNVLLPTATYAVMGPNQPEFTSYESPGATDLVNLATGDFTYQLPILEIPGSERSFSLPLTYRAGIRAEQEASWVGLGWSLNAGAIARSISGYPDDAAGEFNTNTFQQTLNRGWQGSIFGIVNLGWDSETGRQGSVDLIGLASLGWKGGRVNSGDLVGVGLTRGEGVSVDLGRMVMAAVTIASVGAGGAAAAAKSVAWSVASQAAGSIIGSAVMLGRTGGASGSFNTASTRITRHMFHTNYWNSVNDNKTEQMYGELNFGNMPTMNTSSAPFDAQAFGPDIYDNTVNATPRKASVFQYIRIIPPSNAPVVGNFYVGVGGDVQQYGGRNDNYSTISSRPLSIAHDNYSVMGEGISGSIRPFRLEVGAVPYPKIGAQEHYKYNSFSFLSNKPQFRYEGSQQNSYTYHDFVAPTGTDQTGIEVDVTNGYLLVKDPALIGGGPARTAPNNNGFMINTTLPYERRLVQGRHIDWYTNAEIKNKFDNPAASGSLPNFLEFQSPVSGTATVHSMTGFDIPVGLTQPYGPYWEPNPIISTNTIQSLNPYRAELPPKGIGAFAVTSEDGTTYHYSLPVYQFTQLGFSRDKTAANGNIATQMMGSRNGQQKYATSWLLTAVTSPDYIDRGTLGVVDAEDWGGWVKFEYGKFSSKYKWRQPYIGEVHDPEDVNSVAVNEGYKETYYLNSIATRTHTALFIKGVRRDGRGHFVPGRGAGISSLGIDESTPSSSLRLDEIILLTNADATKLATQNGILEPGDNVTVPALTPASNPLSATAADLRNGDNYESVYDNYDVAADSRIGAFILAHALKRVRFNYSYRLCPRTPNSFADIAALPSLDVASFQSNSHTGKLTLGSIAMFGPGGDKLSPDFVFGYNQSNPSYSMNRWDGFGMYASGGYEGVNGHRVSTNTTTADADGAAWSLTDITTPLGSTLHVRYERDKYAFISEYGATWLSFQNSTGGTTLQVDRSQGFTGNLTELIRPGDRFWVSGEASYEAICRVQEPHGYTDEPQPCSVPYNREVTIQSVSPSQIVLAHTYLPAPAAACNCQSGSRQSVAATGLSFNMTCPFNKPGGELRVAALTTTDDVGNQYEVRYEYTTARASGANSSGVLAQEPAFIRNVATPFEFSQLFDYPVTPVIYSKVSVLRGQFASSPNDYESKETYTFHTPHSSMVTPYKNASPLLSGSYPHLPNLYGANYNHLAVSRTDHEININTGLIGQVASLRKTNKLEDVEFESAFAYSDQLPNANGIVNQGYFTEGVISSEMLFIAIFTGNDNQYNINRTTKTYHPVVLRGTTTKANGITVQTTNDSFDPITGQVLESTSVNSLGITYRTTVTPAYTVYPSSPTYPGMGPRSRHPAWKNMLLQEAGTTVTKEANGVNSVLYATAQTWNSGWAYRTYKPATDIYGIEVGIPKRVYRKHESMVWSGIPINSGAYTAVVSGNNRSGLNPDGTLAVFTPYDWSASSSTAANEALGWKRTGAVTLYDHYSGSLESYDQSGHYSTQKLGHSQTMPLLSAGNARYTEVAYSGAEDQVQAGGDLHFGGEVRDAGRRTQARTHTGMWSSQLAPGQQGFTYQAKIGNDFDVRTGKKYRLSVWVHADDLAAANCQLYATINGLPATAATIQTSEVRKAGNWYQLNSAFLIPATDAGKQLVVGCRHLGGSGNVYVDDFRFQPVDARMTAYVYDPTTQRVKESLDDENLFTRYTYDVAGRPRQVLREVLDRPNAQGPPARLLKEYKYNLKRDRLPTWIATGVTRCVIGANGPTGQEEQEEVDQNPSSSTYHGFHWVVSGNTGACQPCQGNTRWIGGRCEAPLVQVDCNCSGHPRVCEKVYTYTYSNGYSYTRTESAPNGCGVSPGD